MQLIVPTSTIFVPAVWNAVVDKNQKMMGVGIIVRNYEGKMLASMCATKPYNSDPSVKMIAA